MGLRKFIVLVVAVVGLTVSCGVFAGEDEVSSEDYLERQGFDLNAKVGANLLSSPSNTNSDNRISFLGAAGMDWFFHPIIGVFADLQYTSRGFKVQSQSSSASYLDIPFGAEFKSGSLFSRSARSHFRLGGYYAAALGNFSGPLSLTFGNQSQGFWGLYLADETYFPIANGYSMGFTIWTKYALGSCTPAFTSYLYELGVGLTFGFF